MVSRLLLAAIVTAAIVSSAGHAADRSAPDKSARIAYVSQDSAERSRGVINAFRERLHELGWTEGQNLVFDQYWAEGHLDRLPELMREALAHKPDVLVTASTPGALAAKKATATVPIVVAAMGDPIQTGVVANLARPGGNLTALSTGYTDGFAGKWLELLLEVIPHPAAVAVFWNLSNPVVLPYRPDLEKVASSHGIQLNFIDVREAAGLDSAFRTAKRTAQAAVVVCENLFIQHVKRVVDLAAENRLPSVYCLSNFANAGGLVSYGVDLVAMFRRGAEQVDKVLRGVNPGDIPVEQPNKYELVVNLRTAKMLGIKIPESVLLRADRVLR
jgi:putative ABC transport system substrate-binding protein